MTLAQSIRLAFPILISCTLVACGGGGGFAPDGTSSNPGTGTSTGGTVPGTTPGTTTTGKAVSTLRLSTSSYQLESDGKIPVTISALAKDANNVLLSDADISISVDGGADITAASGSAIKVASLTPGIADNRFLTVTATAGSTTETIQVEVIGTTLALDGPARIQLDTEAEYILSARDSGSNPIGNQDVTTPTVTGNCTLQLPATGSKLDSAGNLKFKITGSADGECTVSANDFGATSTLDIDVSGDEFTISSEHSKDDDVTNGDDNVLEVVVGQAETITLLLKKDGNPLSNKTINLVSTRGEIPNSVTTSTSGIATFSISSVNSGEAVITATTTEGLTAVLKDFEFVAISPQYINTQASPTIVSPLGKSIITTRIRDNNDNPVKNKIVKFNLSSDTVNGTLNSAQAKTDSLGRASVEYTAGNSSSATDAVIITSSLQDDPSKTDEVHLTVGGKALRLVLGTDNKLSKSGVNYKQAFVVMVTDSSGNPIKDQDVDLSIVPTHYYKGYMQVIGDSWVAVSSVNTNLTPISFTGPKECLSEDDNNNGSLDVGEDTDHDDILEPTHDSSVKPLVAGGKTGADGLLSLEIEYPQSRALWSKQKLVVKTSVNGSDYEESISFVLGIAASDVNNTDVSPPNAINPYGRVPDCSNKY